MIPKMLKRQRDFSAGETDPGGHRRDDRPEFKYGVRRSRNVLASNEGALDRRAGRTFLYADEGVRDDFRPRADLAFSITFAANRFTVRNTSHVVVAELVAPWTEEMVPWLVWAFFEEQIVVAGPRPLHPQVITYDFEAGTFSIGDYAFEPGLDSTIKMPFYRFADKGVKMTPSATKGAITVTFDQPVLKPGHAGTVFRYVGKQIRIDTVVSPTQANATVIEPLNPTVRYKLTNLNEMDGFAIGQIVETQTSGVRGEVIAIDTVALTVTVVVMNQWRRPVQIDRLIGPTADADMVDTPSVHVILSPGATIQWDEQFMSDLRGWPQSVARDAQRLIYCDFPEASNFVFWSATGEIFDGRLGDEATNAILEQVPAECTVYHVAGGYDEFVLTSAGAYYVPISAGNPLAPGTVEFRLIFRGSIAKVKPLQVTEGVLFVDGSGARIHTIAATGQTARPYIAQEVTSFHHHLFDDVVALAASNGDPHISSRRLFAVNGDGSLVVGRYQSGADYVGWFKMSGAGRVQSIAARYDDVTYSTIYEIDGDEVLVAERDDSARLLDCSFDMTDTTGFDTLEFSDGSPFQFSDGEPFNLSLFLISDFVGATIDVIADGFYLGAFDIGEDGAVEVPDGYAAIYGGFNVPIEIEPNLEDFEGGEAFGQRLRRRKVSKVVARMQNTTQFSIGGREFGAYRQGENMDDPVPARTESYTYRQVGRSHDPNYQIRQVVPGPFRLLELTTEMTI